MTLENSTNSFRLRLFVSLTVFHHQVAWAAVAHSADLDMRSEWPRPVARFHSWREEMEPSPICWTQVHRGWPGGRLQPVGACLSERRATAQAKAPWAGVWLASRAACPNKDVRWRAIMSVIFGRLVRRLMATFVMRSDQRICRIWHWSNVFGILRLKSPDLRTV